MECLLPFSSPYTSLPSSKLPSDIRTVLRLELHSAHTEHIFRAPADTSDTGDTAPAGGRRARKEGEAELLSCNSGTDRKMDGYGHSPRRLLHQDSEGCLGTWDPVQACHLGPLPAEALTHSWGFLPGAALQNGVSDPGLAKALASTLTAGKSFLLLLFIIQMLKNGLAV